MASKKVPNIPLLAVLTGTEEFHLVAGVVRDGAGNVTNDGNSRHATLAAVLTYVEANADGRYLQKASNLSDVASASSARTNLGLGSAATFASSAFLQTANNLSDLGNVGTARTNLSVYSKAEVDAAIAGAGGGGPWYAGHVPTAAILSTLMKATATTSHVALTSDANVGLILDSTDNGQAGGNFKVACQATPSDAADWTATCHLSGMLLTTANNVSFGIALVEQTGSSGAWPLANIWGPGTFAGQFLDLIEALADFSYNSNRFQRGLVNASNMTSIWLRVRWVVASAKYFFDVSMDGKSWLNVGSQSKADLLFNVRATHIGLGFYMSGANASAGKNLATCDYWVVG